jgi:hypothetical protein
MNGRELFAIFFFLLSGLIAACRQTKTTYQKLDEVAIKINKTMPQILDEYVEVDSLKAIYPDTLQYYCKLIHINITPESISRMKQLLETRMLDTVKTQQAFKPFRENKVKIVYRYYDENKVLLFAVFLTPEKYLN